VPSNPKSPALRWIARGCSGSKGRSPSPAPLYPQRVGWLVALSLRQASLGRVRNTSSGTVRNSVPRGRRPQAPRPLGRQPHGRRGRLGRPAPRRWRPPLPSRRICRIRTPSETQDRRSWAIPWLVGNPKSPRADPTRCLTRASPRGLPLHWMPTRRLLPKGCGMWPGIVLEIEGNQRCFFARGLASTRTR